MNLFISSIFIGPKHIPFGLKWDNFLKHGLKFSDIYNYDDARVLLELSLMVTESSYLGTNLNTPEILDNVKLFYEECPLPLISKGLPNIKANNPTMVAHIFHNKKDNILIIVFSGTINECMAGLDLAYTQVEAENIINYIPGLRVHKGVYLTYQSIRDKLIKLIKPLLSTNPRLIITGHSLGGALSQLSALDLAYYNPLHYSFAGPMIFNEIGYRTFNNLVKNSYRVANSSDLVVISPLPVMPNKDSFFHVGKLIDFQRNLGDYSPNHTTAYIQEYKLL
jgi:predicted lipase